MGLSTFCFSAQEAPTAQATQPNSQPATLGKSGADTAKSSAEAPKGATENVKSALETPKSAAEATAGGGKPSKNPSVAADNPTHQENLALIHIGSANSKLLHYDPAPALEDLQRASLVLEKLNQPRELNFLITFGKVVAYDNLGLEEECYAAMTSLFYIFNQEKQELEESLVAREPTYDDYERAAELMRRLAIMAPSPNVRNFLLSFVYEMSEELLPSLKLLVRFH